MAGFDAGAAVEKLSYDFTAFGGGKGDIPEPSPEQVASFWAELIGALTRHAGHKAVVAKDGESEEARDERLRQEVIEGKHRSIETIARRRELVSELCSGTPSVDDLCKLPARVLAAFEAYIQEALSPEASSTATK